MAPADAAAAVGTRTAGDAAVRAAEKLAPALRAMNQAPEGSQVRSATVPVLEAFAAALREAGLPAVLVDPVMAACLIDGAPVVIAITEAVQAMRDKEGTAGDR